MRGDTHQGTIVLAPFSAGQVLALNVYQAERLMHPFTCETDHSGGRDLVATLRGWVCLKCCYTQDWAHAFMADWIRNRTPGGPLAAARVGRRA